MAQLCTFAVKTSLCFFLSFICLVSLLRKCSVCTISSVGMSIISQSFHAHCVSLWFHYCLIWCIFRAFLVLDNAPAEVQAPIRCRNETAARRHNVQRVGSDTAGTSTHWFLAVPNWPKQWLKDAELNGT